MDDWTEVKAKPKPQKKQNNVGPAGQP